MSTERVASSDTPLSARSQTRRRLLGLMASLALVDPPENSGVVSSPAPHRSSTDPIARLFVEICEKLRDHEQALARCHQIEVKLVADIGYPRVRLPQSTTNAPGFAAAAETITRGVPPKPYRDRLHRRLRRRQKRWGEAAHASGLIQAQVDEADRFEAVRVAAQSLYETLAATVTSVMLKLLVLLSHESPGLALRDASPWRQVHIILADLDRLTAEA